MAPQATILAAFDPTIPDINSTIATTEIKGSISLIFSTKLGNNWYIKTPPKTGSNTTFTTDNIIAKSETSTHDPPNKYTKIGVINGASKVENIVIPTDKAVSPSAI